jgi:tetratricopeptide (TPR) repeat protein
VLPVDVEVQAVQPHAHYRAHEMSGSATLPDGTTRSLIEIKDWDFRWQHVYRYAKPFSLPKGTTLAMRYTYDNSAENPRNPVVPPRRVYWGQRSADEMGDLWIQVLTPSDRDLDVLNDEFNAKVMAEDVIGYERWIQSEPMSTSLHDGIAILYLQLKRPNDAVRHFAISAAFQPTRAEAHFNLGTALTMAGQLPAATAQFRRALELKPEYAQAHNNLGSILLATGDVAGALPHLAEAVRIDPANAQAQYNMGVAHQRQGRTAAAIASYRRALQVNADQPAALADLAWLLSVASEATLREPAIAVRLAERAVALTAKENAAALDVLAAAYASAGNFMRAVETADAAIALKPSNAADISARRTLYAQQQAYRLP